MTPQEVIKRFMAGLTNHDLPYSNTIGTSMLDAAIQSSSRFGSVQDVIDSMKADQVNAEKEAVEEVLGSDYAGKTLSEIDSSILNADAKIYDINNTGNAYGDQWNDSRTTVERLIKERKAIIFLEKYCGIQLANNYWINSRDSITYWSGDTTGNVDTGAISGSDANITLTAGDVVNGTTLTAADLQTLQNGYGAAASLSSDGQTIIIGTGTEKTDRSIVPEIGNKYTATTAQAQNITTGSNDWLVVATSANDTIQTGGADSVDAGAGNDQITVGADYASILTGAGNDTVEISASVKNVTLGDLNSNDILKISGTFEVGSAQIEDTLLVITDKTGTRKIRLGDFDTAKNAKINSTTIAAWLTNSGIDLDHLSTTTSSNPFPTSDVPARISSTGNGGEGQIAIDSNYTPTPIQPTSISRNSNSPTRSSDSTGTVNVNLDDVTLTSGDFNVDNSKVGEISNEFPNVSSYTKNGLTINLIGTTSNSDGYPDNFTNQTFDQLTDDQKTIVTGLFKWWAKECLKLNEESYGISFNNDNAMVKEIGLYFYDGSGSNDDSLAAVWNWSTFGTGKYTTQLMLSINMDYYAAIKADNFDGESSKNGAGLLDRTLAHEFTHAMMATNIHYFNSLPKFIKEGMAELTHGIDDERGSSIFRTAYDANWLAGSLDLTNTGTGWQNVGDAYSGGYMFLRYFAKQAALQTLFNSSNITLTDGKDTYSNTFDGVTITALADNDSIWNSGSEVSIYGGDGNDYIVNAGSNVFIDGGAGDDSIENYGANVSVNVSLGNDTLFVGEGVTSLAVEGFDAGDVIQLNATVNNLETIAGGIAAGNVSIGGITAISTVNNSWESSVDSVVYKEATLAGAALDGTKIIRTTAADTILFTLSGVENTDGITVDTTNKIVTLTASNLDKKNVTVDGDYTLALEGVAAPVQTKTAGFDGTAYKSATFSEGYTASGNTITYSAASGGDTLFTLSGIKTTDGVIVDTTNKIVILSANNLDNKNVTVDGDYILILNGVAAPVQTKAAGFDGTSYKTATFSEGYTASGNTITYSAASGGETLFTLNGVKNTDGVIVDTTNKIVILTAINLDKKNVMIDDDYTLMLNGVAAPEQTKAAGFDGTAYKTATVSEGYTASGNTITYSAASGGDTLFTLNGVKNTDGVIVDTTNKIVILTAINLDKKNVTVDDDYTLMLNDVAAPAQTKAAGFDGISYKTATFSEGYTASGNTITYSAASGGNTLFTLSGVKNTTGIKVNTTKKTITLSASNLDKKNVTVDGDYTLALNGVAAPAQTKTAGFDGTSYKTATFSEGYTASGNTITYSAVSGGETLFTLSGVKNTTGIKVNTTKKTVTLSASNLNKKNVTVDGGYTLKLASDVDTTKEDISKWTTLTGGNVAYLKGGKGSYYSASGNKVTYNASVAGANKFELSGIKGTPTLSGDTVKLKASNFKSNVSVVSNAGGYKVSLSGDFKSKTFTATEGKDSIIGNGKNITIAAGKGNDSIQNSGSNVVFYYAAGDGKDIISGFNATSTLSITGDEYSTKKSGKNLIVTVGSGKVTLQGAASLSKINIDGTKKDPTLLRITDSTKSPLTLGSAIKTADASARTKAVKITGNSLDNTIISGAGNDTLAGGDGSDVFIYSGGKDVITDYTNSDKISLGAAITKSTVSGSNVVITTAKGKLTVQKAKGKTLNLINSTGKEYSTVLGGTTLTLTNAATSPVSLGASIKTADASTRTTAIKIVGNSSANTILGGKGNDTLTGGKGKDVFIYSAGNDVITDYATGDKISIGAAISKTSIKGSDAVFTIGKNTLTVKKGKDKELTFINAAGKEQKIIGGALLISNSTSSKVSLESWRTTADASSRTKAVKITGNKLDNIIYGGSGNDKLLGKDGNDTLIGGKGKDTLTGGKGNDSLWGGDGADTFIYASGDGNDVIYGFANNDMLQITGTFSGTYNKSKKEAYFKVGSTAKAITLKNFSETTFNVNGDAYHISGKKLVK